MPVCGGWAFLCGSVINQNKRPAPFPYELLSYFLASLASSPPSAFRSPFPTTQNRLLRIALIPSVAGCTTGSLCPRCPYTGRSSKPLLSQVFVCGGHTVHVSSQKFRAQEHYVPLRTEHGRLRSVL